MMVRVFGLVMFVLFMVCLVGVVYLSTKLLNYWDDHQESFKKSFKKVLNLK